MYQGANIKGLERLTKKLVKEATEKTRKEFKNGVNITHIPALEVLFSVPINIHSLKEDGSADVIYLSRLAGRPMYLNLYKNHFSYVHKINTYAKRFQCRLSERTFNQSTHPMMLHVRKVIFPFSLQMHIPGHAGYRGNEEADRLSREGAVKPLQHEERDDHS